MLQLPRLLDRLDEIGLRRVDGEVLWSHVVTNIAPQDQVLIQFAPSLQHCSRPGSDWSRTKASQLADYFPFVLQDRLQ